MPPRSLSGAARGRGPPATQKIVGELPALMLLALTCPGISRSWLATKPMQPRPDGTQVMPVVHALRTDGVACTSEWPRRAVVGQPFA